MPSSKINRKKKASSAYTSASPVFSPPSRRPGARASAETVAEAEARAEALAQQKAKENRDGRTAIFLLMFIITGIIGSATLFHKDDNLKKPVITEAVTTASTSPAVAAAPSGIQYFESEGAAHVNEGSPVSYRLDPPVSGPHYAGGVEWGYQTRKAEDARLLHNLAQGGIVIYYRCSEPTTTCGQQPPPLLEMVKRYSAPASAATKAGIILTPHSRLPAGAEYMLTAWQVRYAIPEFKAEEFQNFISAFLNSGPEKSG